MPPVRSASMTLPRRAVALLALAAVCAPALLLPGCARPTDPNPYAVPLDKGTGGIGIIVQDDRKERVENATVTLFPWGLQGKTNDLGMFVARDLTPQSGTAVMNAPGYYDAQASFTVQADTYQEVVIFAARRANH